jgi:hypothetical protein
MFVAGCSILIPGYHRCSCIAGKALRLRILCATLGKPSCGRRQNTLQDVAPAYNDNATFAMESCKRAGRRGQAALPKSLLFGSLACSIIIRLRRVREEGKSWQPPLNVRWHPCAIHSLGCSFVHCLMRCELRILVPIAITRAAALT